MNIIKLTQEKEAIIDDIDIFIDQNFIGKEEVRSAFAKECDDLCECIEEVLVDKDPTPNDWIEEKMKEFDKKWDWVLEGSINRSYYKELKLFIKQSLIIQSQKYEERIKILRDSIIDLVDINTQQKEAIEKGWKEKIEELKRPEDIFIQGSEEYKYNGAWNEALEDIKTFLNKLDHDK